ncbi:Rab-GTPase-TBC domain-containing protein 1 [Elsinoe australis]|uniref:Rab-GTPase-TBC domain-containing protein 1 n=1 Tax=Elsinoe australis TaxID=40998 RepID=A0A4U7B715_9PEZI|nr:Rab-GTPase-TBC domain-containing protein 1 [Elsinoe australis]
MRTLEQARKSWQELQSIADVQGFRDRLKAADAIDGLSSRSIYWKVFLLFERIDHSNWLRKLGDSRSAYVSLRGHLLRAIDHPDEVDTGEDPLSEDASSPWKTFRQDEGMRAEIMQDVDRCMPENTYFRLEGTQAMILDILFIFCKLNPDVGYRQGMHELLAPILWVIECDAIQNGVHGTDDFMISQLCDSRFIEHDAFTLFGLVMQNAKHFYEQKAHRRQTSLSNKQSSGKLENPIITVINRIFDDYLPRLDPELATHLRDIDLVPQVFLMRWVRLLFGREFSFDDVLPLWDVLFSQDPGLDLVEMICLVMMLRIRWDLLESDHNECLALLLRYPPLPSEFKPRDLAFDAVALRKDFNGNTARTIIRRYTGREPTPSSELPDPDDFALLDEADPHPPIASQRSPRNFESLLQTAAKDVMSRGEKWGINKAVRDAVEEVRKGVRDIQTMQTPTPPRRHSRVQSRASVGGAGLQRRPDLERKLSALQQRNEQLAGMLKQATDQLWEFQKVLSDEKGTEEEKVKELSMSIARVGFVQVYLEDASIPLPVEEERRVAGGLEEETDDREAGKGRMVTEPQEEMRSESRQVDLSSSPPKLELPREEVKTAQAAQEIPKPATPLLDPEVSRPTLAQSSFSWMLGQDDRASPFGGSSASSASRPRSRGFLFGDDGDDDGDETPVGSGTPTRKKRERKIVRKSGAAQSRNDGEEEEDGFDLNDLKNS